jgi:hypothetical protein
VTSPRSAAVELVAGRGHYQRVIAAVLAAETSVWIGTANVKELLIEDHRAAPGRRRTVGRAAYRSILAALAELAGRGVELRILHAERPSRPFAAAFADQPEHRRAGRAAATEGLGHDAGRRQRDEAERGEQRDEGRRRLRLAELPERELDRADVDEREEDGDQTDGTEGEQDELDGLHDGISSGSVRVVGAEP